MRMTAMLGYARVSTIGQDLDAQLAALDAAGVDPSRVFTDKLSGSAKTARPGLVALLDYARPGDTVVVAAIDRLGRSVAEVTRTIADLGERRITLTQWWPCWPAMRRRGPGLRGRRSPTRET
jgi:DNA invertase Pin-like site-specific DNA recombinase